MASGGGPHGESGARGAGSVRIDVLATRRLALRLRPDSPVVARTAEGRPGRLAASVLPAWLTWDLFLASGARAGEAGLLFREDGGVEIGYRIEPSLRRQGLATEALEAIIALAASAFAASALEAETAEDNVPSMATLTRLGFTATGEANEQWSQRRQAHVVYRVYRRVLGSPSS